MRTSSKTSLLGLDVHARRVFQVSRTFSAAGPPERDSHDMRSAGNSGHREPGHSPIPGPVVGGRNGTIRQRGLTKMLDASVVLQKYLAPRGIWVDIIVHEPFNEEVAFATG